MKFQSLGLVHALRFSIVCLVTHAAPHPFPREIRFGYGELAGLPLLVSQFPVLSRMSHVCSV
jgi:hypothetical protein